MIARGSKPDGRDALRLGSREPGAAVAARAQTKKPGRLSQRICDLLANFGLRVKDSKLKDWETLSQFFNCRGASRITNAAFSRLFTSSA